MKIMKNIICILLISVISINIFSLEISKRQLVKARKGESISKIIMDLKTEVRDISSKNVCVYFGVSLFPYVVYMLCICVAILEARSSSPNMESCMRDTYILMTLSKLPSCLIPTFIQNSKYKSKIYKNHKKYHISKSKLIKVSKSEYYA